MRGLQRAGRRSLRCVYAERSDAFASAFPALRVTALGAYEGTLRAAVLALKDGRRDVAEALGRIVAPFVEPGSLLVPIPTTARRRRMRGVDGVAFVARRAAQIAGARVVAALEQRSGDAQRGRSRTQRLAARGRFACNAAGVAGTAGYVVRRRLHDRLDAARLRRGGARGGRPRRGCRRRRRDEERPTVESPVAN